MIKAILLAAFVPFLTQHRNITPSNEVSTCFYGSVTGIVDNAYIAAHGGGGSGGVTGQFVTNAIHNIVDKDFVDNLGKYTNATNAPASLTQDITPVYAITFRTGTLFNVPDGKSVKFNTLYVMNPYASGTFGPAHYAGLAYCSDLPNWTTLSKWGFIKNSSAKSTVRVWDGTQSTLWTKYSFDSEITLQNSMVYAFRFTEQPTTTIGGATLAATKRRKVLCADTADSSCQYSRAVIGVSGGVIQYSPDSTCPIMLSLETVKSDITKTSQLTNDGSDGTHPFTTKSYADNTFLPKTGGTISGVLSVSNTVEIKNGNHLTFDTPSGYTRINANTDTEDMWLETPDKLFIFSNAYSHDNSVLKPDGSPVATSNMVRGIIAPVVLTVANKANKCVPSRYGRIATLDLNGNLMDSGFKTDDFLWKSIGGTMGVGALISWHDGDSNTTLEFDGNVEDGGRSFRFAGNDGRWYGTSSLTPDNSPVMTQNTGDARYLRSFTESDPTVPSWAKSATPPEGMTANAVVLTNSLAKTKSGTAVTGENIKYASTGDTTVKGAIENTQAIVQTWESFLDGSNVVFSITNYISGAYNLNTAKLRVLEMRNGAYQEVYNSRGEIVMHIGDFETNTFNVAIAELEDEIDEKVEGKADKAWGKYTSAGGEAPSNTVYMTAPNTVFAGGMEYERVAVGLGSVCVLTTKGAPVYTQGDEGTFKFQDDGGTNYFGFAKSNSYTLGCDTDGISVSGNLVTLVYEVTMSGTPCVWYKQSLENNTPWEQLNTPDGNPIPGASKAVSWDTTTPGRLECFINCSEPSGFFKATVEVAGAAKFMTNMPADLERGIICTNTATGVNGIIKPSYNGSTVQWTWSAN